MQRNLSCINKKPFHTHDAKDFKCRFTLQTAFSIDSCIWTVYLTTSGQATYQIFVRMWWHKNHVNNKKEVYSQ